MWNCKNIKAQILSVMQEYPDLQVIEKNKQQVRLSGKIHVYRSAQGFILNKYYKVTIVIPSNENSLPILIDTENAISSSYVHKYSDGSLCLETDTYIRIKYIDKFELVDWMKNIVEPYFFSYEFFTRFGKYPFGERDHYILGVLQTYQEYFEATDILTTWKLMQYLSVKSYKGHHLCPCGSGEKIRNCHGHRILPFVNDCRKRDILKVDLEKIEEGLAIYDQARRNNEQTKRT